MLSFPHLIVIFIVALVVFGPEKLPELARQLGKWTAEFRRVTGDLRSSFDEQMRQLEREAAEIDRKKRELAAQQATAAATQSSATLAGAPQQATSPQGSSATATIVSSSPEAGELPDTRATENDVPSLIESDTNSAASLAGDAAKEDIVPVSRAGGTPPDRAREAQPVPVRVKTLPEAGNNSHGDA